LAYPFTAAALSVKTLNINQAINRASTY